MPYRHAAPPAPLPDDSLEVARFRRHLRGAVWGHLFVAVAGIVITCGTVAVVRHAPVVTHARPACSFAKHTLPTGEAYVVQKCGDEVTDHYLHDPRVNEL